MTKIATSLAFILLIGCNSNNSGKVASVNTDSINRAKAAKDSLINIEQKIAISNINFGINEKEFNRERDSFYKKTRVVDWVSENTGKTFYKNVIGNYEFQSISGVEGEFFQGKLYSVLIKGDYIRIEDYDSEVSNQLSAIYKVFENKYGEPTEVKPIPAIYETNDNYMYMVRKWEIGNKVIKLFVHDQGTGYYSVDIEVYQNDVVRLLELKDKQKKDSTEKAAAKVI